ncbi:MAG: ABC transporter ATP-binding protein [Brevinematia bacterium]
MANRLDGILKIDDLSIVHRKSGKTIVREIGLELREREILGIVGESGSGKSITVQAILRILPESLEIKGKIFFEGVDILSLSEQEMVSKIRGKKIAMIFQDPLNALNPILRIRDQLKILSKSHSIDFRKAEREILEIFNNVGIYGSERVLKSFPHQLSGGILQRVVISFILLLKPKIIIADEPTTSLDVSIQKEIIKVLNKIKEDYGVSILFITHDLLLARELCDRVMIMYSGYVLEEGDKNDIFQKPLHPYTKGLISSIPSVNSKLPNLTFIPGRVPHFLEIRKQCPFAERCGIVEEICYKEVPTLEKVSNSKVRCFLVAKD